jgi:hypothetical protein
MTPREVMQAIKQPTGDIGSAFYFHPATLARGKELGLDGLRFYVLGRGGVLGDTSAAVVHSAFGYFHPDMIAKFWNTAKEHMPPGEAAAAHAECCHELGRRKLADVDGLEGYVDAATAVIGAVDGGALTLFAGYRTLPVPDDTPAAAIHQAMVLRELRGSAHLAAIAAVGLATVVAHAIKRPDDIAMFGYEGPPAVSDADREAHRRAEDVTDDILVPAFSVLGDDQSEALVAGTRAMYAAIVG